MAGRVIDEPSLRGRAFIFRDRRHAGELLADRIAGARR